MPGRKRKSATAEKDAAAAAPEAPASRRRSQRVSASAQKSKYFEAESDTDAAGPDRAPTRQRGRGRPSKRAKTGGPQPESKPDADDGRDNAAAQQEPEQKKAESSDESFDEDAPPRVTFVPLPKLRDTGGIEYADDRLHPNTFAFLADLKANNKRSWLKTHDQEYRRALKDWETYVMSLTDKIIEADPTIPELPFKDVNFRIYRDIRFSNDPTPYKPHFSAAFSRTGRKGPYACYYVHVEPGACFVGGGLWRPDGEALHKLRASIDERPRRWRRVLGEETFRRTFLLPAPSPSSASASASRGGGGGVDGGGKKGGKRKGKGGGGGGEKETSSGHGGDGENDDAEAALRAFAEANREGALKTRPKGFIPDHRDMELLKLRNFTVGKKVADAEFTSLEGGQTEVVRIIRALVGFVAHLNRIVMPDPGDDDDDSDDE